MSTDTTAEHGDHAHAAHLPHLKEAHEVESADLGGHHESPEVVDGRQRMAIWLFIGGDIITTSALLFTYLYLRGVNTGGHWMSMLGYPGPQMAHGHTYAYYENALSSSAGLANPTTVMVSKVSVGLNWMVTLLVVVSALIVWGAEKNLRRTRNRHHYSRWAALATAVTIVAVWLTFKQLQNLPQIFVATNDSQTMSYTTYDSSMMVIIGSGLLHLFLLTFLGVGLTLRSSRGAINGHKWHQARLVRLFWVWVGISSVVVSAVTTFVNVIH
jgi:heme/copper-type cytochrome/quinol oxidase subunit 3